LHFSTIASFSRIEFCAQPGILIEMDQFIFIGNMSRCTLARTRMAKSLLDCGWGRLRRNCCIRASTPADAFESSMKETPPVPVRRVGLSGPPA
jgi:hypothetical protein